VFRRGVFVPLHGGECQAVCKVLSREPDSMALSHPRVVISDPMAYAAGPQCEGSYRIVLGWVCQSPSPRAGHSGHGPGVRFMPFLPRQRFEAAATRDCRVELSSAVQPRKSASLLEVRACLGCGLCQPRSRCLDLADPPAWIADRVHTLALPESRCLAIWAGQARRALQSVDSVS
jgi:hypothetical protein